MSKRLGFSLFLLMALLFLAMNRGAYRGYFTDDEIDNLSWTPHIEKSEFLKDAVSPVFFRFNFRPVGHLFFHIMEGRFGLDFPKYAAAIHIIHLLNCWLLWVVARRLGSPPVAAAAAVVFFAFHMALFDALWKPMYVFDVLCATFSLLCLLLWMGDRWILAFVAFWLAYRSKELAVMLPAVLACYEYLLGKRRWKPLIPFFAASLSFGLQGVLLNPNQDNDYTFRFTPAAIARTSVYYAGRLLLIPSAGFALLAVPLLTKRPKVWFGLALAGLSLVPLLFLPGRLFSAYCYVPFLGVAIMISAIDFSERWVQIAAAAALLAWLPWDYQQMRVERRAKLAKDDEVRAWVGGLREFARRSPEIDAFVFSGAPAGFQRWGIEGAIKYFYRRGDLDIRWSEDPEAAQATRRERFAMLTWDGKKLEIASRGPDTALASYVPMDGKTPVWQLGDGWFGLENTFRWIRAAATARVYRPAGAGSFEVQVNIGPEQFKAVGGPTVTVELNGQALEPCVFKRWGWQTCRREPPSGPPGPVEMRVSVSPGYRAGNDPRDLGVAIGGFGFVEEKPQ
jgi:hypothetical protein